MDLPVVTVFGGTGFLGRRAVRHLRAHAFSVRVAARRPERGRELFDPGDRGVSLVAADVRDAPSVAAALAGAYGAVNAVSLYVERGGDTFERIHVTAARRLAAQARLAGVQRLVHLSGVGSDPASPSRYIRKRGEGELAVRDAFQDVVIVRPTVMFGLGDAFLSALLRLVRRAPVVPLFGGGTTRLQPSDSEDVAEAIARAMQRPELQAQIFELGGPQVYRYRELIRVVAAEVRRRPLLVPIPFAAWRALARVCELLPSPPVSTGQVDLMRIDTVASPDAPGFAELSIAPEPLERTLQLMATGAAAST